MQSELTSERRIFQSTELVGRREIGMALAAVAVSVVLFIAALPFASMPMVSISGGISILSVSNGATAETLIIAADKALYAAKRRGRNRMVSTEDENGRARLAAMAG